MRMTIRRLSDGKKIRIVTDSYGGFEVQVWRWWWPFWVQFGGINTHRSLERARLYARRIAELSLQIEEAERFGHKEVDA